MIEDRLYQTEIKVAIGDNYDKLIRQQLVSAATGTGKTRVFSGLPDFLRSRLPGRMLVLAHREELIDQGIEKLVEANPSLSVTKEMGGYIGDVNADVIAGSVATLGRKGSDRAERFPWESIDKVITDEAHHATSDTYTNIYTLADILRQDTHKLHVGFTATPQRADGKALAAVFKKIVYEYSLRRAIEEGYLVEPKGIRIKSTTSLDDVKQSGQDYSVSSLADAINTPERNQLVVKAWLQHGENRPTIGFTADIRHAVNLAQMFVHYGVKAEAVWGDDPERSDKIARSKSGETVVLLNCGILTEGYDDPQISCILLARPTKSGVLYCQMVGRGTRLFLGKSDCIVIDVVDATSKNNLLTLPTLMGLNAKLDLKRKGIVWAVKQMEDAARDYPAIDFSQLDDIESLQSFIESVNLFEVKFAAEVEGNSDLTWYASPTGGYVMSLPKPENSHWSIQPDRITINENLLGNWEVYGAIKGLTYRGERGTIEEAFQIADKLVLDKAPESLVLLRRHEEWHDVPATEPQMKYLRTLVKAHNKKTGKQQVVPLTLSKGAASKLISQFKVQ